MLLHDKLWTIKNIDNKNSQEFIDKLGISSTTAKLLQNRDIKNIDDARIFLNPRLDYLHDPYKLKDMDNSVKRINRAVEENEGIWIYGSDYISGVAGTAILKAYFNSIDFNAHYHIYNRDEEEGTIGYSFIDHVNSMGGSLIIGIDCAINSHQVVQYGKSLGIDIIIINRYDSLEANQDGAVVINPRMRDCDYPDNMLSVSGITFKLIQGLTPLESFREQCFNYLDIVAIETIAADLPITGENRVLVRNGLEILGIPLLARFHGKVEKPLLAVDLLLSKDYDGFINMIGESYNNNSSSQGSSDEKISILEIDKELSIEDIGFSLIEEIEMMAPFGRGNPRPLFLYKKAVVERVSPVGDEGQHLKLLIHGGNRVFDCIGLNLAKDNITLSRGEEIDLVFNLELSVFKGIETIQLNIKDLRRRCWQPYGGKGLISHYHLSFTEILREFSPLQGEFTHENILDLRNTKDRAKYVIENMNLNGNSSNLILINTLEGLMDLSLYLRDINEYNILESISFNVPNNDNRNTIIVNPILNDFNFKNYENIYIYDIPIMKEKIDALFNSGRRIHVLYGKSDTKTLADFLNRVIPDRDDLVEVYKYLKKYLEGDEIAYMELIKDIKTMNLTKLKFCLDVLSDTKLLNYHRIGEKFHIELLSPPEKKLDITASKSYKNIGLLRDSFEDYSKNAFSNEFK